MTKNKITIEEAERMLNIKKFKPTLFTTIAFVLLLGLFWVGVAAAYKFLLMYLFGG